MRDVGAIARVLERDSAQVPCASTSINVFSSSSRASAAAEARNSM